MHIYQYPFKLAIRIVLLTPLIFATACATTMQTVAKETCSQKTFSGRAHWYGKELHGNRTASGVPFDRHKLTAAHPHLPFGTKVKVVSRHTGKDVVVEINDRCPEMKCRVIDLSEGAAKRIGIWPGAISTVDCEVLAND